MTARQKAYLDYYTQQAGGGGLNVFRGGVQRGHGLGNILSSVFKLIKPLALKGAKTIGRQVLHSGLNTVQDVVQGVPIQRAMKRRGTEALHHLMAQARQAPPQGPPQGSPRGPPQRRQGIKGRSRRGGISRTTATGRSSSRGTGSATGKRPRRPPPDIFS